jgi:uncharacterized membrane protein YhfC
MVNVFEAGVIHSLLAAAAQTLTPLILLPGIGMLLVGVGFAAYAWRRRLGIRYVAWGAVAWVVSVALKFAWAISLNKGIYAFLTSNLPTPIASTVFYVYVGLLTGIFEVALVWAVLKRLRVGHASWEKALAFGIGFGSVEAILLGASSLAGAVAVLVVPDQLPASAIGQFALANNPLFGLAPIIERAATIFVHILSCALIFFAIATGEHKWAWLAVVYKTALDSVAAFAQFWGVNTVGRVWTIEAIVILFGILGWWGTHRLSEHYPSPDPNTDLEPEIAPLG